MMLEKISSLFRLKKSRWIKDGVVDKDGYLLCPSKMSTKDLYIRLNTAEELLDAAHREIERLKALTGGIMITIKNRHTNDCGVMPEVKASNFEYLGYFQNIHGEQWILTKAKDDQFAILCGGDALWGKQYQVGPAGFVGSGLILDEMEKSWLAACVSAIFGVPS